MSEPATRVHYAVPIDAPTSQRVFTSAFDFETTLATLRASIERAEMWLIHEIDPQRLMTRGGYDIHPARQLLFFHPRFMARLLETNSNALVEAPLKIIVLQLPDGRVSVRHPDVAASFAAHPGLGPMGAELATIYESLRASVDAVPGDLLVES